MAGQERVREFEMTGSVATLKKIKYQSAVQEICDTQFCCSIDVGTVSVLIAAPARYGI